MSQLQHPNPAVDALHTFFEPPSFEPFFFKFFIQLTVESILQFFFKLPFFPKQ